MRQDKPFGVRNLFLNRVEEIFISPIVLIPRVNLLTTLSLDEFAGLNIWHITSSYVKVLSPRIRMSRCPLETRQNRHPTIIGLHFVPLRHSHKWEHSIPVCKRWKRTQAALLHTCVPMVICLWHQV